MPAETLGHDLKAIGPYVLVEKIAEGGMGTVYRGRAPTGETVAVKVVSPKLLSASPVLVKRFEQEYHAAKTLDHPHIVKALDFGRDGDTPFLVMEFVDGESLGQKLERERKLPERDAVALIAQIAKGLHKAHQHGLVHRDVKPDNILVTPAGVAKLTDLGLVKELETDQQLTRTGRGLGTPHFMAPEQFKNAKGADARCDVYALAATLYMTVTGALPFDGEKAIDTWLKKMRNDLPPPRAIAPELSERVDWAIRRAMDLDPARRPATCREFLEDLTGESSRPLDGVGPDTPWHVAYVDKSGEPKTLVGTTAEVRRGMKAGRFGDLATVQLARGSHGEIRFGRDYPEFRDIVLSRPLAPPPSETPTVEVPAADITAELDVLPPSVLPRTPVPESPAAIPLAAGMPSLNDFQPAPDWGAWMTLAFVSVAAAVGGYFVLPYITRFR
jgi:serine/threonine protein kinase